MASSGMANWGDYSINELQTLIPSLDEFQKMKVFRELERRKNRHEMPKGAITDPMEKKAALEKWLGSEFIRLNKLLDQAAQPYIKGDINQVTLLSPNTIQYADHVTRIHSNTDLGPAVFTRPLLSANPRLIYEIDQKIQNVNLVNADVLKAVPESYTYDRMEDAGFMTKNIPVDIGLPPCFAEEQNFVFNENRDVNQCVLHMPVKLSKSKCSELNTQGRVGADDAKFSETKSYVPVEFEYLVPFITHAMDHEVAFNPYFFEHYYLFVSVSHSDVEPNQMQRRGGWHVDGHQGYERIQESGTKLPTDRQYTISNVLPTEYVTQSFCFDKLREYLEMECCSMDSVNFQHVLETHVGREIELKGESVCVRAAKPNTMTFFNPYVVHKAAVNMTDKPVRRTFVRLLFSVYPRDRLGDSVNPLFGPIYPMKIKVITDIHEPDVGLI